MLDSRTAAMLYRRCYNWNAGNANKYFRSAIFVGLYMIFSVLIVQMPWCTICERFSRHWFYAKQAILSNFDQFYFIHRCSLENSAQSFCWANPLIRWNLFISTFAKHELVEARVHLKCLQQKNHRQSRNRDCWLYIGSYKNVQDLAENIQCQWFVVLCQIIAFSIK